MITFSTIDAEFNTIAEFTVSDKEAAYIVNVTSGSWNLDSAFSGHITNEQVESGFNGMDLKLKMLLKSLLYNSPNAEPYVRYE